MADNILQSGENRNVEIEGIKTALDPLGSKLDAIIEALRNSRCNVNIAPYLPYEGIPNDQLPIGIIDEKCKRANYIWDRVTANIYDIIQSDVGFQVQLGVSFLEVVIILTRVKIPFLNVAMAALAIITGQIDYERIYNDLMANKEKIIKALYEARTMDDASAAFYDPFLNPNEDSLLYASITIELCWLLFKYDNFLPSDFVPTVACTFLDPSEFMIYSSNDPTDYGQMEVGEVVNGDATVNGYYMSTTNQTTTFKSQTTYDGDFTLSFNWDETETLSYSIQYSVYAENGESIASGDIGFGSGSVTVENRINNDILCIEFLRIGDGHKGYIRNIVAQKVGGGS